MRYLITVVIAALSLNAFGQVPNYVPSDGLVAWYPFNGNANDESGNGNNGTVVGASATIDRYGNLNSALEFLGAPVPGTNWTEVAVDNHVSVPNFNEGFQNGISISLWSEVYPTSESAFLQRRNNNNIDFSLGVNNSQQLGVHLGFINFGSTSIIVNEWTHIVLTYDEQTVQLFKNGMLIASEPSTQNINSYDDLLLIGKYIYYGGYTHHYFFNGKQDELGIWNRALTETEIQALYTAEIPISGCTDPTACNFDTEATSDDGSCIPSGCMDTYACNFNSEAECEGEACDYTCCPGPGCCDEGLQWDWELSLCQDLNPTDTNLDGCTDLNDLMDLLVAYGDCAMVETNYSLNFDGVDDYVDAGNCNFLPNTSITIATWLKSTNDLNIDVGDIFVSDVSWSTYTVRLGTNGALSFRIQPNAGSGGNVVSVNTISNGYNYADSIWHHLACTWDGGSISIYVDGIQVGQSLQTNFNSVSFTNDNATIGCYPTTSLEFFEGELDDLHIWDSALTQEQIQSFMSTPPTGNEEGLVGYWDFNEGTGSTLTDQTSNGNDGIINGATWSSDVPTAP